MSLNCRPEVRAYQEIKRAGPHPKSIRMMVGASGEVPKWLMLSRLDQYLSEHLLTRTEKPITPGSSVGAWRMACYARSRCDRGFSPV